MRALTIAVVSAVLVGLLAPLAVAQPGGSPLCPAGYNSMFNTNGVACTFCSAPTDCHVECLGPPVSFCPPNDPTCCAATPCAFNCPLFDTLQCNVSSCICEPGSCCSTVCPDPAPAPAASGLGMVILTTVLVAFGMI